MTDRDGMHTDVIRLAHPLQGMPGMSWLSTRRLAARLSQIAWTWLGQSIARRWFAAVPTVFGELIFKLLDASFQLGDQLNEMIN